MADRKVILEMEANTTNVVESFVDVEKQADETKDSVEDLSDELEDLGKTAKKSGKDTKGGLKDIGDAAEDAADKAKDAKDDVEDFGKAAKESGSTGAKGMKLFDLALKATGVGFIVGLVMELAGAFLENKKVVEALQIPMNALAAVVNLLIPPIEWLAEWLIKAFENPQQAVADLQSAFDGVSDWFNSLYTFITSKFMVSWNGMLVGIKEAQLAWKQFTGDKEGVQRLSNEIGDLKREISDFEEEAAKAADEVTEPFEQLADAVVDFANAAVEATKASNALTRQEQKLADAKRELGVQVAQEALERSKLQAIIDNERLSIDERIKAAEEALARDSKFMAERVRIAEEEVSLIKQRIEINGATEESLQALADAEIEVATARQESADMQSAFNSQVYAMEQERKAQEAELAAFRRELRLENATGLERELADLKSAHEDRLVAIDLLKISEEEKAQLRLQAEENHEKARAKLIAEKQKEVNDAILESANSRADTLAELRAVELNDLALWYDEQVKLADQAGMDTTALTEEYEKRKAEIQADYAAQEAAANEERIGRILGQVKEGLALLQGANELFGAQTVKEKREQADREAAIEEAANEEERYRLELQNYEILKEQDEQGEKQFERGKVLDIAQTTIDTYASASAAYRSMVGIPVVGPGLAIGAAAAATAAGLASVNAIRAQEYSSLAGAPPVPPSAPTTTGGGALAGQAQDVAGAPALDLSVFGEGSSTTLQAYVIGQQVTTTQQAEQLIQEQANFAG